MTEAPERVWRTAPWTPCQERHGLASWPEQEQAGPGGTEYIRADLVVGTLDCPIGGRYPTCSAGSCLACIKRRFNSIAALETESARLRDERDTYRAALQESGK